MNIYPTLKKGSSGAAVEKLQKALSEWWSIPCAVDGDFGSATEAAVKQFQRMRQTTHEYAGEPLVQDGVVGLKTWAELLKVPVDEVEAAKTIVTKDQLKYIFGRTPTDAQVEDINNALVRFDITTAPRIRHFLAQCGHESGGLRYTKELATGEAYEMRRDLGNTKRGQGVLYKGAGLLQITGRYNYQAFADFVGDPKVLELGCDYVAEHYAGLASGYWWYKNNMNILCDRIDTTVAQVSQRVNGKHPANGLEERKKYYKRACEVIL